MKLRAQVLEEQLRNVRAVESQLTYRLSILSRMLDQQAVGMLEDTPLNLTSFRILYVVGIFSSVSISDISRFCAIDRAQVSRTAVGLEKLELVTFHGDAASKRKKLVALTEKGVELLEEVRPRFVQRNKVLEELLGDDLRKALDESISRILETL